MLRRMSKDAIQVQEVESAQRAWGDAVVHVGAAPDWEQSRERAAALVQSLYCADRKDLLFCPTKVSVDSFRRDERAAVSYFVGRDSAFPEDGGFALEPWTSVRFENAGVVVLDGAALAMGHYYFGRADGSEIKVEYSFVYVRDVEGALRIQLHHSALPYRPE